MTAVDEAGVFSSLTGEVKTFAPFSYSLSAFASRSSVGMEVML